MAETARANAPQSEHSLFGDGMRPAQVIHFLFAITSACIAASGSDVKAPGFVFPGSRLVRKGVECPQDQLKRICATTNTADAIAQLVGVVPEARKEMADPFVSERLPFVEFDSTQPGLANAAFYTQAFKAAGWKEGRGILAVEYTNCGGDWLRVFTRGTQQVLVHVCGALDRKADETPEWVAMRTITLRLFGMMPGDLLGPDFGKEGAGPTPR